MTTTPTIVAKIDSKQAKTGADEFVRATDSMRAGATHAAASVKAFGAEMLAIGGATLGVAGAVQALKSLASAGDALTLLQQRMKAVSGSGAGEVFNSIQAAAARARVPVQELASTFTDVAAALKDKKRSVDEGVTALETLAKAAKVSGASDEAATEAMKAYVKAVNAGKIEGGEFFELTRRIPALFEEIQRQTGLTGAQLKKYAELGKISGTTLTDVLVNASKRIDDQFQSVERTVSGAAAGAFAAFNDTLGEIAKKSGALDAMVASFDLMKRTVSSPEMKSGLMDLAKGADQFLAQQDRIRASGESTRKWLDDMGITSILAASWNGWAKAVGLVGEQLADTAVKADMVAGAAAKASTSVEALSKLRGTVKDSSDTTAFSGGRKPEFTESEAEKSAKQLLDIERQRGIMLAATASQNFALVRAANEEAEVRQKVTNEIRAASPALAGQIEAQIRLNAEMQKAADAAKVVDVLKGERDKAGILQAQVRGQTALAEMLTLEADIRQRITPEMREANALGAAALETQIRQNAELQRAAEKYQEFLAKGENYARTLVDGIYGAAKAGKSFGDALKDAGRQMAELALKTEILEPMIKGLGKSFASLLTGTATQSGGGIFESLLGTITGGLFGGGGAGGWTTTVVPAFAKGGVLPGPAAFSAGGMKGIGGEAGPEAIMPLSRGSDGVLGVRVQGAGNISPTVNINISGNADKSAIDAMRGVVTEELGKVLSPFRKSILNTVRSANRRDPAFMAR